MTLRDFLNASYALLVETWTTVQAGRMTLIDAVEKVEEHWPKEGRKAPEVVTTPNPEMQMRAMLAGVKGAPV